MNCSEQARQAIKDMIGINPTTPTIKRREATTNQRGETVLTSTETDVALINPIRVYTEASYGAKEENGATIKYKLFGFGVLTEYNEVIVKGDSFTTEGKTFEVDSHAKELRIGSEVYGKKYTLKEL